MLLQELELNFLVINFLTTVRALKALRVVEETQNNVSQVIGDTIHAERMVTTGDDLVSYFFHAERADFDDVLNFLWCSHSDEFLNCE